MLWFFGFVLLHIAIACAAGYGGSIASGEFDLGYFLFALGTPLPILLAERLFWKALVFCVRRYYDWKGEVVRKRLGVL